MPRGSRPGERRGGRKKGVPNKLTASSKAALEEAFKRLGGVSSLVEWGQGEPTEFYRLWSKLIPADVKVGGEGALGEILIRVVKE